MCNRQAAMKAADILVEALPHEVCEHTNEMKKKKIATKTNVNYIESRK